MLFWAIVTIVLLAVSTILGMISLDRRLKLYQNDLNKTAQIVAEMEMKTAFLSGGYPNLKSGTVEKLLAKDLKDLEKTTRDGGC